MDFEAYLISKKIDSKSFQVAEPALWSAWKSEFDQISPNSFTSQKLYLINPVRRKYPLKIVEHYTETSQEEKIKPTGEAIPPAASPKPTVARPVFKPKPKMS